MRNLTMFAAVAAMVFCAVELNAQCGSCGVSAPVAAPAPVMTSYVGTSDCNTCCQSRRVIRRRSDCCCGTYTSTAAPVAMAAPMTYATPIQSSCCGTPAPVQTSCCGTPAPVQTSCCGTPAVRSCCGTRAPVVASSMSCCPQQATTCCNPRPRRLVRTSNCCQRTCGGCASAPVNQCGCGGAVMTGVPLYGGMATSGCGDCTSGQIMTNGAPVMNEGTPVPAAEGSPVEATPAADATGDTPPTPDDA